MSIQNEIYRVNGEVSTQTDLLKQISTALDGKGSGAPEEYTITDRVSLDFPKTAIAGSLVSSKSILPTGIAITTEDGKSIAWREEPLTDLYRKVYKCYAFVMPSSPVIIEEGDPNPDEVPKNPIEISASDEGLITATLEYIGGYVSAGISSGTLQLPTQAAQTITPSTADQTIASGKYLTGIQTIKGDANLIPGNIVAGESIFGVNGTAKSIELLATVSKELKDSQAVDGKNVWNSGIKIYVDGLKAGTTYQIYGGYACGSHNVIDTTNTSGCRPLLFNGRKIVFSEYSSSKGWYTREGDWAIENNYLVIPSYFVANNKILNLVIFKQ